MVPIHRTGARYCFPNRRVITADTKKLTLEIRSRVPNPDNSWNGPEAVFRWGFSR
jgi:hypothetical protein